MELMPSRPAWLWGLWGGLGHGAILQPSPFPPAPAPEGLCISSTSGFQAPRVSDGGITPVSHQAWEAGSGRQRVFLLLE